RNAPQISGRRSHQRRRTARIVAQERDQPQTVPGALRNGLQEQRRADPAGRGGGYLPSPLDIAATRGHDPDHPEKVLERKPADNEPFSGLAFKIMADSFVGQLVFVRVYSGHLKTGDSVLNTTKGKSERIGRLLKMHANKREEISEIYAGDICACVGLKHVTT